MQLYDPRTNGFAASSPEIGMHVEIRDPEDKIILSKVYSSEGKFTFTSHMPGEHVICLYSNSTKWFSGSQLRVHLDIQVSHRYQLKTPRAPLIVGWRTCHRLCQCSTERKVVRVAIESQTVVGSGLSSSISKVESNVSCFRLSRLPRSRITRDIGEL